MTDYKVPIILATGGLSPSLPVFTDANKGLATVSVEDAKAALGIIGDGTGPTGVEPGDIIYGLSTSPLPGWPARKRIDLPVPTANLTDFPVEVPIVADADIGAACLATGYDLRFTAADGTTLLSYERQEFAVADGEATGIFWVKTNVATTGTYIWCYYGNVSAADGENAEAVWDDDFKAVYHMKDATTSTILDSTGNNNDGAKKGANEPVEADGKIGKGQGFDGTDDYVEAADSASLDIADAITISAWVKASSFPAWATVLTKGISNSWSLNNYTLGLRAGRVDFRWGDGGSCLADIIDPPVLVAGSWYLITCVAAPGTVDALCAYVNGATVKQANRTGNPATSLQALRLGTDLAAGGDLFVGLLDEIRLSSIARSVEWIAYEFANMNPADGGLTWGEEETPAVWTRLPKGTEGQVLTMVSGLPAWVTP